MWEYNKVCLVLARVLKLALLIQFLLLFVFIVCSHLPSSLHWEHLTLFSEVSVCSSAADTKKIWLTVHASVLKALKSASVQT